MKSAQKLFAIIEALQELDGARITELSRELDIPKSTVHRHIETLHQNQYVVREDGVYYLSMKFLDKGRYVQTRKSAFRIAEHAVEEIAQKTDERCQFAIEEHGRGIYVHVASGEHAVKTDSRAGGYCYLHTTACGKSLLAHLPSEDVDAVIERWGLPQKTRYTITDRESLETELAEIRDRGYAFNDQGRVDGLRSVGVPVFGRNSELVGALSVSGPSHRMKGTQFTEDLPAYMLGIANEIELNIRYD